MDLKKRCRSDRGTEKIGNRLIRFFRTKEAQQDNEAPTAWTQTNGIKKRLYASYEQYREHQASKFAQIDFPESDSEDRLNWRKRFHDLNVLHRGDTVLCLGARLGTECKAFIDLGCFCIGIDLEPGPGNEYVTRGDFHHLQFADESIDYVFTNAMDHSFDINRVLSEIHRVLKPNGGFIAEIAAGSKDRDGLQHGNFESIWWDRLDTVAELISEGGFRQVRRTPFTQPWNGEQALYRKSHDCHENV